MSELVNKLTRLYENARKLIDNQDYESANGYIQDGLKNSGDVVDSNGEPFVDKFRTLQQRLHDLQSESLPFESHESQPMFTPTAIESKAVVESEIQAANEGESLESAISSLEDDEDYLSTNQDSESPDQIADQLLQQAEQTEDLAERLAILLQVQEIQGASSDSLRRAMELRDAAQREQIQAQSDANLIKYKQAENKGDWQQAIAIAKQSQSFDGNWDNLLRQAQNNLAKLEDLKTRWQALSNQASTTSISTLQTVIESGKGLLNEAQALHQLDFVEDWQNSLNDWQQSLVQHQARRNQLYSAAQQGDAQALVDLAKFDPDSAQSIQDDINRRAEALAQSIAIRNETGRILSKEPYAAENQLRKALNQLRTVSSSPEVEDEIKRVNALLDRVREAKARKSISQTLGETLSEFDTPEALNAVNQSIRKEIEDLEQSGAESARIIENQEYYDSNLTAFKRVATARLRNYIHIKARPLLENSPFDVNAALKVFQDGLNQWRGFQKTYLSEDGNLKYRLEIVAQQTRDLSEAVDLAERLKQQWQSLTAQSTWEADELLKSIQEEILPTFNGLSQNAHYLLRFLIAALHQEWCKHAKQAAKHLTQEIKRLWVELEDQRGKGAANEALAIAEESLKSARKIDELQAAFVAWQQKFNQTYQSESIGEKRLIDVYAVGDWHIVAPVNDAQQKVEQMQIESESQKIYFEAMQKLQEGQLLTSSTLLHQIPANTFYATKAQPLLALMPNLKEWHQNAIEDENHRRYLNALTNYQKILTEFPDAKFAAERSKLLQPLAKQWQDTQTWLRSAKAAIERDDFANALGFLKNIPDEFKQEQEVQETRQHAEGGHQEAERIKHIKAQIRQLWQSNLSQDDYEQIGELLKGLPQSDSAYPAWQQRWLRAAQIFEKIENREQSDQQLLELLENLPTADQESEYAQKLMTQIKQRITERQDSAGIQQQLDQALNDNRFADALYIAQKIIDTPKKYAKLQEYAKNKRASAQHELHQQITAILELPPAQRDSQLSFVRSGYKALVDVFGQTMAGLIELGEAIQRIEKIAEITRLLNDTESDNSKSALSLIGDFRQQFGSDAELDELQARSELRRFSEIGKQAYTASEMQKAVENFDKAISAYKRISRPNDFEKNLFKYLQDNRGRARRSAIFESVREKWHYGDFKTAREALSELPESDTEAQRYLDENNKLESLTLDARNASLKNALPAWHKVLAQKPDLVFAKEQCDTIRRNLLEKAKDLVKRFVDITVEQLSPEDINALIESVEYAQLVLEDSGMDQPEALQIKNQAQNKIRAWQGYLSEQKNKAEQEGVDWEAEQFERLAGYFESAIQFGWFSAREQRTVIDLRTKAEQVRALKTHIEQAKQHYQNTLITGSGDFQDAITAINKAAQEPFFGLRKETINLRKKIQSAQTEVHRLRSNYAELERSRKTIQQQPLEPFDDLSLRQSYEVTKTNLETALDAVKNIFNLDPEDKYNLPERGWLNHQGTDPLKADENQLNGWLTTLESMRSGLEEIKQKLVNVEDLENRAREKEKQCTSVGELQEQSILWENIANTLKDLRKKIDELLALPADMPTLRRYQARLKDIKVKYEIDTRFKNAQQQQKTLSENADTCEGYLKLAREQYASQNWEIAPFCLSLFKNWQRAESAKTYYELVLSVNTHDAEAGARVNEIKSKLKEKSNKRQACVFTIIAILLVVSSLGIGFAFGCPNGSCLAALQPPPTATATRQMVTRIPSATPTQGNMPTIQPSATPMLAVTVPPTATPTPVYTQCRMNTGVRAYPKNEPGKSNLGNGNLILENTVVVFLDSVEIDGIMWYYVAYPANETVPLGWINLIASPCTIVAQP